jgi:transcriptional antiterminator NusG
MEGFTGVVKDINSEDGTADVSVSMFGRETLATLEISQVKAADEF